MRIEIDSFFATDVPAFLKSLADLDQRIGPTVEPRKDDVFKEVTAAFERVNDACRRLEPVLSDDPALLKEVQTRFRSEVSPVTDRSWFIHQARVKPRGYPGDYEMLSAIYDRQPKNRGLAGYMDLYFLDTTLGRAVAARLQAARSFLVEELENRRGEVSVLNVASGPGREYVEWPSIEDCTAHVTCVDYDKQALAYVQDHVATAVPPCLDINCVWYNALRMSSAKANIQKFGRPDIIYSVGLFDYIPDKHLVPMLQGLYDSANDGGVVYVAFKDCRKYDKIVYQWHVDWYFFQRTEEECRSLLEQAGFDMESLEMTRDTTASIINFICRVKPRTFVRVDAPETQGERQPVSPARTHATRSPKE